MVFGGGGLSGGEMKKAELLFGVTYLWETAKI